MVGLSSGILRKKKICTVLHTARMKVFISAPVLSFYALLFCSPAVTETTTHSLFVRYLPSARYRFSRFERIRWCVCARVYRHGFATCHSVFTLLSLHHVVRLVSVYTSVRVHIYTELVRVSD